MANGCLCGRDEWCEICVPGNGVRSSADSAHLDKAVRALQWYASADYRNTYGGEGHIAMDRGQMAQRVLKEIGRG